MALLSVLVAARVRPQGNDMLVAVPSLPAEEASPPSSANRSGNGGVGICTTSVARSNSGRCWPSPVGAMQTCSAEH